jgi:hypothetical protein
MPAEYVPTADRRNQTHPAKQRLKSLLLVQGLNRVIRITSINAVQGNVLANRSGRPREGSLERRTKNRRDGPAFRSLRLSKLSHPMARQHKCHGNSLPSIARRFHALDRAPMDSARSYQLARSFLDLRLPPRRCGLPYAKAWAHHIKRQPINTSLAVAR